MDGWIKEALCASRPRYIWLSYIPTEVEEAKSVCMKCPVRIPCLYNAVYEEEFFVGVRGGYSEYDFLVNTWVEVKDDEETNWPRTDSVFYRLFNGEG